MKELEEKYKRALDILARHFYVIVPVFIDIEKVETGVFTIREKYKKGLPEYMNSSTAYHLSLEDIELIYEAMCESSFSSSHSRDQWALVLYQVREWEAVKKDKLK